MRELIGLALPSDVSRRDRDHAKPASPPGFEDEEMIEQREVFIPQGAAGVSLAAWQLAQSISRALIDLKIIAPVNIAAILGDHSAKRCV